jgi:hypothetical protein
VVQVCSGRKRSKSGHGKELGLVQRVVVLRLRVFCTPRHEGVAADQSVCETKEIASAAAAGC